MKNIHIETKRISKYVNIGTQKVFILSNVNISIYKGELVAITGKSGSGKSTLLSILAGLDKPSDGEVWINGTNLYKKTEKELSSFRNEEIGVIFQNYNLLEELTCYENIEVPLIFSKKRIVKNDIKSILEILEIEDKEKLYPAQMSGGEQQRTAIGRAIVNHPGVICADEPTGSLDSLNSNNIINLLKKLKEELNTTIILVTHDEEIAKSCDRKLVLKDGRVFEEI